MAQRKRRKPNGKFRGESAYNNRNRESSTSMKDEESDEFTKSGKGKMKRSTRASNDMSFLDTGARAGGNDPSWYTHIYPAWETMSRVPFNIMTGLPYNPVHHMPESYKPDGGTFPANAVSFNPQVATDPGILLIDIMPVLGNTGYANRAAQQLYTLVRKANSGATNYDQTDLMMYILAMDSAYMMYQDLARVYSIMSAYDYLSRYSPRLIVHALGYDYDDLLAHKTQFKAVLDQFAYELGAFCVPQQLDLLKRHSFMFSNIYEDEMDGRAQLYAFRSTGFYRWIEGTANLPTHLRFDSTEDWFGSGSKTYAGINNGVVSMLRYLWGSQDIGTINGDILKAFGPNNCIKISTVSENFIMTPVHNDEVMMQIQNAETLPHGLQLDKEHSTICQYLNDLNSGPRIVQSVIFNTPKNVDWEAAPILDYQFNHFLNLEDDVSGEAILTSTRLKQDANMRTYQSYSTGASEDIFGVGIESSGTEIVTGISIVVAIDNASGNALLRVPRFINVRTDDFFSVWNMMTHLSKFRYAPNVCVVHQSIAGDQTYWQYLGNLQNHTKLALLSHDRLRDLHNVCIQSEYAVLDFGKGITQG